jgi:hypothetical protein
MFASRSHRDRSFFCTGQCRDGNRSGGGTIFDTEFGQDAFDVLALGVSQKRPTRLATPFGAKHIPGASAA